jgi:hypothetical protein
LNLPIHGVFRRTNPTRHPDETTKMLIDELCLGRQQFLPRVPAISRHCASLLQLSHEKQFYLQHARNPGATLQMSSPSADGQADPPEPDIVKSEVEMRCDYYEVDPKSHSTDLCYCNVCKCTLCSNCWTRQVPHWKQQLGPGGIPHEKTDLWVAEQAEKVLSPPPDHPAYQQLYLEDEETAWFGESESRVELSLLI